VNTPAPAEILNRECGCESPALASLAGFHSKTPVFVDAAQVQAVRDIVAAVHAVVALPAYGSAALANAPDIARVDTGAIGVFTGFDFHIAADGPRLIEINSNAGGAMINAAADWRYPECCAGLAAPVKTPRSRLDLEREFIAMFRNEWLRARGQRPLRSIAIVDERPAEQFLFPEFELFADLFARHGIEAFVADAAELELRAGNLEHRGRGIDLVYNRVTDFYFEQPAHAALREAHATGAALITPDPRAHALLADKRNLVRLTDPEFLRSAGASESVVHTLLSGIPRTHIVTGDESWWRDRKAFFFKPVTGFGSRGAYRGDKLTRRVFAEVLKGGYVAQQLAPPGERRLHSPGGADFLKVDLRAYTYDARIQLLAARLYQGQTTNFRTVGGGFAPVLELHDGMRAERMLEHCAATGEVLA
jgi:hypothetical protein